MSGSVVSWESSESLSQLEWEECAGERKKEKCSPSPLDGEEDALFRVGQRARRDYAVSNDTVSCCSIQQREEEGGYLQAGWSRVLQLGAVQGKELCTYRKPRSRAEPSLAQSQHCNGSRPSGLAPAEAVELSLFVPCCQSR